MCGICGMFTREPAGEAEAGTVRRMNAALAHRGPDGEGFLRTEHGMLAMRRLSIIDLQGGWQPLYNEDRTLVLVANGEIYNHLELRSQLEARGHRFQTGSDCEPILHLYEESGTQALDALRGMFAFALWDSRRDTLVLARDRLGEKPLYLYSTPDTLLFASELKALLASGRVPAELDPEAVQDFFHYQFVPEPRTPIRGVVKLEAATVHSLQVKEWNHREWAYWELLEANPISEPAKTTLATALEDTGGIILRSEVPVGLALSGGLDSAALACLLSRHQSAPLHTITVGYEGRPPFDEREAAAEVAQHLGLPHTPVEIRTGDLASDFDRLVRDLDDPIADISSYGYWRVMRAAREAGVPVMLQGHGGDELFWGYPWVRDAVNRIATWQALQGPRPPTRPPGLSFTRPPAWGPRRWLDWMRQGMGSAPARNDFKALKSFGPRSVPFYDAAPDYQHIAGVWPTLRGPALANVPPPRLPLQDWQPVKVRPDLAATRLICDIYLRENGVAQGDRLAMAHSVELRLPLLDHRVIETVIGLRKSVPDHTAPPKALFRRILQSQLPIGFAERHKRGFQPPVREWWRSVHQRHRQWMNEGPLRQEGWLNPQLLDSLAAPDLADAESEGVAYRILVLDSWYRQMQEIARPTAA